MRCLVYSSKSYDEAFLSKAASGTPHELTYVESRLSATTMSLARGYPAICCFVNDQLGSEVLGALREGGTEFVALRCAGFNNIDLPKAKQLGMKVARVPAYSPHAVAEHTLGLILSLNRKIHKAYLRVRDNNFSLEGLMGFDLHGKTVGVVGTGEIGQCVVHMMHGLGCRILMSDMVEKPALQTMGTYVKVDQLLRESDIVTLHCPLNDASLHLIRRETIEVMKPGVMLINTSRGGLIDTQAVINGLKKGLIGSLGLDVYEEESQLFFQDRSQQVVQDDTFSRLLTFPNVLVTAHQAFFTEEAMSEIARVTLANLDDFANQVTSSRFL